MLIFAAVARWRNVLPVPALGAVNRYRMPKRNSRACATVLKWRNPIDDRLTERVLGAAVTIFTVT